MTEPTQTAAQTAQDKADELVSWAAGVAQGEDFYRYGIPPSVRPKIVANIAAAIAAAENDMRERCAGELSERDALIGQLRINLAVEIGSVWSWERQCKERDAELAAVRAQLAEAQKVIEAANALASYIVMHPQLVTVSVSEMAWKLGKTIDALAAPDAGEGR